MQKTILITGCSGRIGKRLVSALKSSYHIVGIDSVANEKSDVQFDYYQVDISSDVSTRECFNKIKQKHSSFHSVIHLIAYYSFNEKESDLYEKITVLGTKRILSELQSFQVDQFIFSSTLLVHTPCSVGEKISETSPVEPAWEYPESKVETEALIKACCTKIPYVILRIAGCYDDTWCHSIPISQHIKRIYENKLEARFYPGNPEAGDPYLHFDDLVKAIRLCIEKQSQLDHETVLILGEGKTMSYRELQNTISEDLHNKPMPIYPIPRIVAQIGSYLQSHAPFMEKPFIKPWMIALAGRHYELDISKAKRVLGWSPEHDLTRDLHTILRHLKENPQAWYEQNHLKYPG